MQQFIAFIPVDNGLDLGRNDFENVNNVERLNAIKSLKGIGVNVKIYNISDKTYKSHFLSLLDFITDYNDEELDGGFWVIDFTCPDEKKLLDFLYGEKKKLTPINNMQFYLDNAEQTENGCVYKNRNYDTAGDDEIVYISEDGLNQLQIRFDEGKSLSDSELVKMHIASTKNSIRQTIKDYWTKATDEWIDKHELIADVIQSCTWEYAATMIDQMGNWDIWDDYPEK